MMDDHSRDEMLSSIGFDYQLADYNINTDEADAEIVATNEIETKPKNVLMENLSTGQTDINRVVNENTRPSIPVSLPFFKQQRVVLEKLDEKTIHKYQEPQKVGNVEGTLTESETTNYDSYMSLCRIHERRLHVRNLIDRMRKYAVKTINLPDKLLHALGMNELYSVSKYDHKWVKVVDEGYSLPVLQTEEDKYFLTKEGILLPYFPNEKEVVTIKSPCPEEIEKEAVEQGKFLKDIEQQTVTFLQSPNPVNINPIETPPLSKSDSIKERQNSSGTENKLRTAEEKTVDDCDSYLCRFDSAKPSAAARERQEKGVEYEELDVEGAEMIVEEDVFSFLAQAEDGEELMKKLQELGQDIFYEQEYSSLGQDEMEIEEDVSSSLAQVKDREESMKEVGLDNEQANSSLPQNELVMKEIIIDELELSSLAQVIDEQKYSSLPDAEMMVEEDVYFSLPTTEEPEELIKESQEVGLNLIHEEEYSSLPQAEMVVEEGVPYSLAQTEDREKFMKEFQEVGLEIIYEEEYFSQPQEEIVIEDVSSPLAQAGEEKDLQGVEIDFDEQEYSSLPQAKLLSNDIQDLETGQALTTVNEEIRQWHCCNAPNVSVSVTSKTSESLIVHYESCNRKTRSLLTIKPDDILTSITQITKTASTCKPPKPVRRFRLNRNNPARQIYSDLLSGSVVKPYYSNSAHVDHNYSRE